MAWHFGNSRIPIWRAVAVGLVLMFSLLSAVHSADATSAARSGLGPLVERARGGQCVEEPAYMRRNHMKLLKHQRDDTMHGGIRSGKYSLKECVACHANKPDVKAGLVSDSQKSTASQGLVAQVQPLPGKDRVKP
jgi:hypothetical protein